MLNVETSRLRKRAVDSLKFKKLPADVDKQISMSSQMNVALQRQQSVSILSDVLSVTSSRLTHIISLATESHVLTYGGMAVENDRLSDKMTVCKYAVVRQKGS